MIRNTIRWRKEFNIDSLINEDLGDDLEKVFINVPWWYLAFYTMINPFLTQRTKSKFVFASPSKTAETLFKYISLEQVPIQYGGLSVDFYDCNLEFSIDDPATEITVKPATKQAVEILVNEVARLNTSYPRGLASYIQTARELLADSKAGNNPFDGFTPSVPSGESLTFGDNSFVQFEEAGVKEMRNAAFVLVAGGLGERLGYNGIKVALPRESSTGTCFLQHYIESILALQDASCKLVEGGCQRQIPFVIMTSDDTHARTLAVLESNDYFGMAPTQVKLLKQEKVACLDDNDARLAVDPHNKYRIQTKPHGHGDVHSLLYSSGLLNIWKDAGLRWVLFFQDTNGLLFKGIPAALGVSATMQYHVNSLAVPRKAKEAIGGIAKLTHIDGNIIDINDSYLYFAIVKF